MWALSSNSEESEQKCSRVVQYHRTFPDAEVEMTEAEECRSLLGTACQCTASSSSCCQLDNDKIKNGNLVEYGNSSKSPWATGNRRNGKLSSVSYQLVWCFCPADTGLWHLDQIVWIWHFSKIQQEPFKHLASLCNTTRDLSSFDCGSQEKVE